MGNSNVLEFNFEPDLWPARIDTSQFEAAVLNLVVNARDAMPEGGRLEISTGNVVIDAAEARRSPDLTVGAYVLVCIADTGTGMDPDVAAHAFEPFFTTKEVGKGTGLKPSQVYGFIKQSGGHVVINSSPGLGTTFRLYLPRCDHIRRINDSESQVPSATPTGHETVLVVEDNAEVLELAVDAINDLGYRVLSAADGPSALDIVQGAETIDLLFSDVVMPGGMNGFELINRARAIRAGLRVLVTSGYTNVRRSRRRAPGRAVAAKAGTGVPIWRSVFGWRSIGRDKPTAVRWNSADLSTCADLTR